MAGLRACRAWKAAARVRRVALRTCRGSARAVLARLRTLPGTPPRALRARAATSWMRAAHRVTFCARRARYPTSSTRPAPSAAAACTPPTQGSASACSARRALSQPRRARASAPRARLGSTRPTAAAGCAKTALQVVQPSAPPPPIPWTASASPAPSPSRPAAPQRRATRARREQCAKTVCRRPRRRATGTAAPIPSPSSAASPRTRATAAAWVRGRSVRATMQPATKP